MNTLCFLTVYQESGKPELESFIVWDSLSLSRDWKDWDWCEFITIPRAREKSEKKKPFDKKGNNFVVSITVTVDIPKRLNDCSWVKYPIITQAPWFLTHWCSCKYLLPDFSWSFKYHILSNGQLRNEICLSSRRIISECQLHVSSTHAKQNNHVKWYNQPVSPEFILIPEDSEHKYYWFSSLKDHLSWPY